MQTNNKKIINAWATYDLANSVYNLVITATIFPIYYKTVTTIKDSSGIEISNKVNLFGFDLKNTALYDFALATAYLIVASIIPLLSGIADYSGNKKRFMQFFCYLGAMACSAMYFFTSANVGFGILMAILACVGFSGSLVFYNSYLPEIASPDQQDKVSAKGFAMGYIGSSVLLIINLIMIQKFELFGFENKGMATRTAFLTVGIWWFLFAQIPFYYLPKGNSIYSGENGYLLKGYKELQKVWKQLKEHSQIAKFLGAFFVYSMGVQTVMLVATHFGAEEIKMESGQLITTILIIQFVAMIGAYLFSFTSKKMGNLNTLKIATVFWALICIGTYFFVFTSNHFFVVAGLVGLVMGGIQSLSRSTFSKMLPETHDHASFFSFYDVAEKLSIVFGMIFFGVFNQMSSSMRQPIVILILFFIVGFLLLSRIPSSVSIKSRTE